MQLILFLQGYRNPHILLIIQATHFSIMEWRLGVDIRLSEMGKYIQPMTKAMLLLIVHQFK